MTDAPWIEVDDSYAKYLERLDALDGYVKARDTETARRSAEAAADADAAYERYAALRDQDGPCPELEAGS